MTMNILALLIALTKPSTGHEEVIERMFPKANENVRIAITKEISDIHERWGIEPSLMIGLIRKESYFDQSVISSAGCIGLTQVHPRTAKEISTQLGQKINLKHPVHNIRAGAYYLYTLKKKYNGNIRKALMGYSFGPGKLSRSKRIPKSVKDYATTILKFKKEYEYRWSVSQTAITQ